MCTVPLADFQNDELLALWAGVMRELRLREIIRSGNNPVGDIAEALVAARLHAEVEPQSTKGYDVLAVGVRYQVKCRRWTSKSKPSHYGAIRNIDKDPFDFLIAVHLDEEFQVTAAWQASLAAVRRLARPYPHVNGVRLGVIRQASDGVTPFDLLG